MARRIVAEKRHASFRGLGARRVRGGGRHCCKRRPSFGRLTPLEPRGPRLRGSVHPGEDHQTVSAIRPGNVPHLPDVAITDFRDIHEHRYLPYAKTGRSPGAIAAQPPRFPTGATARSGT